MRSNFCRLLCGFVFAAAFSPAHHSTASYDLVHGTIIQGVVTKFQWENPHIHVWIDVTGENEELEHWHIELESPSTLRRYGWASGYA